MWKPFLCIVKIGLDSSVFGFTVLPAFTLITNDEILMFVEAHPLNKNHSFYFRKQIYGWIKKL